MNRKEYEKFISGKVKIAQDAGFEAAEFTAPLFDFQRDLVRWALRKGKAALFCGTGTGKTIMQLEWAHQVATHTGGNVLVLAPLAVAKQTVREGEKFGIQCQYARSQADAARITIANYEMLQHFDVSQFAGIVLDESSVLKHKDAKTRTILIDTFARTPYRLACTATPAPNDFVELGNHSEFLGVMTQPEMLAMYFCHDGGETQKWRLKGHAEAQYWKWVCSWAALVRAPSDLGYDDGKFKLPELIHHHHVVKSSQDEARNAGFLFVQEASTLSDRRNARRATIDTRVGMAAELANGNDEQWLVWCDLNAEGDALEKAIRGAVQVAGADSQEHKESAMLGFASGEVRAMVTKASVAGFGMNWQNCHNVVFVGVSDSWEQYFQAVRRCWRFGQNHPVNVHIITSEAEGAVVANLERKERDAAVMMAAMSAQTQGYVRTNVQSTRRDVTEYRPAMTMKKPAWLVTEREEA